MPDTAGPDHRAVDPRGQHPGHQGWLGTSRLKLLRDGVTLAETDGISLVVPAPEAPATYTLIQDVDRTGPGASYAPTSRTEFTFRSGAATGTPVSREVVCPSSDGLTWTHAGCTAVPLLVAGVSLATDAEGRLPQGASPVTVTVGHADGARPVAITKVSLEWRVDGAEAWQSVPLTRKGQGTYTGTYTGTFPGTPALAGRPIDVRITADAAGGSLTQTVTEAVAVTK